MFEVQNFKILISNIKILPKLDAYTSMIDLNKLPSIKKHNISSTYLQNVNFGLIIDDFWETPFPMASAPTPKIRRLEVK